MPLRLPAEPWEPGHTGKGVWLSNGKLMTWKTRPDTDAMFDENAGKWSYEPHHGSFFDVNKIPYDGKQVQNELVIAEDGRVHGLSGKPHGVEQIDPRLEPVDDVDSDAPVWDFSSSVVEHSLKWKPGNPGRAVVTEDGAVHTWTHGLNHAEYASRQAVKPRSFYYISPGGNLTPGAKTYHHDDSVVNQLLSQKVAAWEVDTTQPPEVVELSEDQVHPPAKFDEYNKASWMPSRKPWVYWPEDHQVVIGPAGTFHSQILPKHNQRGEGVGLGGIFDDTWHAGRKVDVFGHGEQVPDSVIDHLHQHFNIPRSADDWDFNAS